MKQTKSSSKKWLTVFGVGLGIDFFGLILSKAFQDETQRALFGAGAILIGMLTCLIGLLWFSFYMAKNFAKNKINQILIWFISLIVGFIVYFISSALLGGVAAMILSF